MKKVNLFFIFLFGILLLGACSSDDGGSTPPPPDPDPIGGGGDPETISKYIITALPLATEGVADYLLTADDLSTGAITTKGNGIEQDGTYRYYVANNGKFFSLLYGQGNPGAVTTYELNSEGELDLLSDFQAETVQAFAAVDNDILMTKISRNADNPYAYWYRLDTNSLTIVDEGQINTQELANKENGELAFFSWITQVGDKVYLPYFLVKACCGDTFGTDYPDEAHIAVYSYPEMEYIETITDDRTSYIGSYFNNGLSVDEKGDAYAFSSAGATKGSEYTSTLPSAITRLPDSNGNTAFDDYYYDLEEASGGYVVSNHIYASNGKFVALMVKKDNRASYPAGIYAIIDVYNKTFTWITGMPDEASIVSYTPSRGCFVTDGGSTVNVGVTTETGSYVFNIDVAGATATQGLEVEGGQITAINKLEAAE